MKQCILFICTAVVVLALVMIGAQYQLKSDELELSKKQEKTVENSYYLRDYKGRLSVYRAGESSPMITTDTLVSDLPLRDREKLETGFEVKGDKNLRIALEDYCS